MASPQPSLNSTWEVVKALTNNNSSSGNNTSNRHRETRRRRTRPTTTTIFSVSRRMRQRPRSRKPSRRKPSSITPTRILRIRRRQRPNSRRSPTHMKCYPMPTRGESTISREKKVSRKPTHERMLVRDKASTRMTSSNNFSKAVVAQDSNLIWVEADSASNSSNSDKKSSPSSS